MPRTHDETDEGADVAAAADVEVARKQGRQVCSSGNGVCSDVGAKLGKGESGGDDEDAEALARAPFVEKSLENVKRVPDWVAAKDDGGAGGHDDADKGGDCEAEGDGEELGPKRILGFASETGKIRVVDDEGGEVGNRGHNAPDHFPTQIAAFGGATLVNDWTNAFGSHDGPDEEGNTSARNKVSFYSEEMADLVNREPDCWKRAEPEQEEGNEHDSVGAGTWDSIFDRTRFLGSILQFVRGSLC